MPVLSLLALHAGKGGPYTTFGMVSILEDALPPKGEKLYTTFDPLFVDVPHRYRWEVPLTMPQSALTLRTLSQPLTEEERLLVLTAVSGHIDWPYFIAHYERPLSDHFMTSVQADRSILSPTADVSSCKLFFSDQSGTYFFSGQDALCSTKIFGGRTSNPIDHEQSPSRSFLKLSDKRLPLPIGGSSGQVSTWDRKDSGSLVVVPVDDTSYHTIAMLYFFAKNGYCIFDDINHHPIPGLKAFADIVYVDDPFPVTFLEQYALAECNALLAKATYQGLLMQYALGLVGGVFEHADLLSLFQRNGYLVTPGLDFRHDTDHPWQSSHAAGLSGALEGLHPPRHRDMRSAVDAFYEKQAHTRRGPSRQNSRKYARRPSVKGPVDDEALRACVALQAQYIFDTFGTFPATIPTTLLRKYLQVCRHEHFSNLPRLVDRSAAN
jgi:hypothetical protein